MEKMSELEMKKNRKMYIDGLKGLACFFVMLGHYTGIYKYAQGGGKSLMLFWSVSRVFQFRFLRRRVFGCTFFL